MEDSIDSFDLVVNLEYGRLISLRFNPDANGFSCTLTKESMKDLCTLLDGKVITAS